MVRMDVSSPKPILLPTIQKMVLDRISTFGVCVSFLNENQLIYAMIDGFNMECSELSASLLELARYSSDILGQKPRMVLFPVNPQGENLNAFWQLGQEILDEPFFYPDSLTTLNVDTPCVPKKLLKGIDVFQELSLIHIYALIIVIFLTCRTCSANASHSSFTMSAK